MTIRTALPFALLALAACSQGPAPVVADSEDTPPVATAMPTASPTTTPAAGATTADPSIPGAIQGRWGLVAADCTSTRGDAKGLLTIDATTLKFYESRGTLGEIADRSDTRLAAKFAFSGEGMTWSRDVTLDVQDGGKTLVRTESGVDAEPGPFTYRRCAV